jgi:hypothetical protein
MGHKCTIQASPSSRIYQDPIGMGFADVWDDDLWADCALEPPTNGEFPLVEIYLNLIKMIFQFRFDGLDLMDLERD